MDLCIRIYVYLPLYKVADTPFHIQGDDIYAGPAVAIKAISYKM